jgi:hypothetical protein
MITVGLAKELYFISKVTNQEYTVQLYPSPRENSILSQILTLKIKPTGQMDIYYRDKHIWRETVEGETSFFGIESCDSISKIIQAIYAGDSSWKDKFYFNEDENA